MSQIIEIPCVQSDGRKESEFSKKQYQLTGSSERCLSDQIQVENFRLRSSDSSYTSDWHVAGDPTLLVVLTGIVKIVLRSGDYLQFSAGQMFVAEDFLEGDVQFDNQRHGHRAEVVGDEELRVLHLKLSVKDL